MIRGLASLTLAEGSPVYGCTRPTPPATPLSCSETETNKTFENGTITNNTFTYHGDDFIGCVWFTGSYATGNTVTGNTFNVSETQRIAWNNSGAEDNGEPWTGTNTVNRS